MKIVHLSDTHINTKILYNIDAQDRFRLALNHIKNNHSDADHFMITGDLTNFGDNESYEIFINILSKDKTLYTQTIDNLKTNSWMISFTFE